jgi:hypothetical protein
MPPGNVRTRIPAKVVEKVTAEACIAIARQVQQSRQMAGDLAGSEAAMQVAAVIQAELLDAAQRLSHA